MLLLLAAAAAAPPPDFRPDIGEASLPAAEVCFASGLRLVVAPDRRRAAASVTLVVDGGAAADPPGKEGTAHLLEHLAFRTQTAAGQPVRDRLDALGAATNGETRADVTTFTTLAPAARLAAVFGVEGQRLLDPLAGITPADLDAERAVVEDELRRNKLDGGAEAYDALFAALWPKGHPYAAVRAASAATLRAVTLDDLRAAARSWRPSAATLHVSGDVEPTAVRDLALRVLPDPVTGVPSGTAPVPCASRATTGTPPPPVATLREITAAAASRRFVIGWSLPPAWGADDLVQELAVEELGRISPVLSCGRVPGRHGSTAYCTAPLPEGQDARVFTELGGAVRRLDDRWIFAEAAAGALTRGLWQLEAAGHPYLDTGRAPALAAHMGGEALSGGGWLSALGRVEPKAVIDYAARWLTPERAALVVVTPSDEPADLAVSPALGHATPLGVAEVVEGGFTPPDLAGLHTFTLPTGLRVVVLPYGDLPLVEVGLDFRGGRFLETTPGMAELLAEMEVYNPRNVGFSVNHAIANIGADLSVRDDGLVSGRRYAGPSGNVDDLLFLLRLRLDGSELEWQKRGNFVERRARALHTARRNPRWWLDALTWDRLFPGHPVSRGWLDDARLVAVRATTDAQVEAWRDRVRHPANGTLYVVGRVDPAEVEARVRDRFGSWKGRGKAREPLPPLPAPPAPPARAIVALDVRDRALSRVRVACQLDGTASPEALAVVETVAGDALWEAWRTRTGWSYDPNATVHRWEGGAAALTLSATVRHDAVGDALVAAMGVVGRLAALPADDPAVKAAALARARADVLERFTVSGTLDWLAAAARRDWPASATEAPARLAAVTGADVARAVKRCVGHELAVVAGPVGLLEEGLAGVGAPVEVLDWRHDADQRWAALDPDGAGK